MQRVAAIVVTRNRKALLEKCIQSLLAQKSVSCDVIIIDNDSSDGTEELIRYITDTRIFYYNTGSNLGGAGGFNYGFKKAFRQKVQR